jgi:hypothetical protein
VIESCSTLSGLPKIIRIARHFSFSFSNADFDQKDSSSKGTAIAASWLKSKSGRPTEVTLAELIAGEFEELTR